MQTFSKPIKNRHKTMISFYPCLFSFVATLMSVGCWLLTTSFSLNAQESIPLYWGCALDGNVTADILKIQAATQGLTPQFVEFFIQWPSSQHTHSSNFLQKEFPEQALRSIFDFQAVPVLTWEPFYFEDGKKITISSNHILRGAYDSYLIAFAQQIKQMQKPLIIRLAHEMNLNIYHWGTDENNYSVDSPEIYVKLYRYVVDIFRKEDVKNVLWSFCPNADSVPDRPWNILEHYYPGDSYIDILGMDGYNWGFQKDISQSRTFEQIFSHVYKELKSLSPNKPLIVFETASQKNEVDQNQWLSDAVSTCKKWNISALIWFQVLKEKDWRIHLQPSTRSVFTQIPNAQSWIDKKFTPR